MQTKILGMSGKKQSGKDTATNYIIGLFMQRLEIVENFIIQEDGRLWITDIFKDTSRAGIYDVRSDMNQAFNQEYLYPFVKVYSYADNLKQLCINVLGLSYEQCYGTDTEKDSYTYLKWENMPGITTIVTPQGEVGPKAAESLCKYYKEVLSGVTYHKPGFMTGREVMQFVGTEIFRKMHGNVWVEATMNKIKSDNPTMAIISDVRFRNEAKVIHAYDGRVIRMMRHIHTDEHESEKALDDYFGFDHIVPKDADILQQNLGIKNYLNSISWIPRPISEAYPE